MRVNGRLRSLPGSSFVGLQQTTGQSPTFGTKVIPAGAREGVYDLVGLKFSPRIRNVADQRLWHLDPNAFANTPLNGHCVNRTLIEEHWDGMLRVGASIHSGAVLPSLLLSKLQSLPRQNAVARALQEYGRLIKTAFILKYLQQPETRKRSGRQLNCIAAHNARLLPDAISELRTQGNTVNDQDISYLGPTMTENLTGRR